ncbi:MAG: AAA family ATPase [Verrucomicrobiota bacterium]
MEPLNETEIAAASTPLQRLRRELNGVLFGQEALIDGVLTGLLARGHLLLEGLPGLGKTELVKALSRAMGLLAKRIQFTPDLLPGDITGSPILQETGGRREFVFQPGPLFGNLILADEINRASPKTQSALLEAMQERRVTVMGVSHPLPDPFFVVATQNPIELEGTYPLPEAQLDRFLFKLDVPRAGTAVLEAIVNRREIGVEPPVEAVLTPGEWDALSALVRRIYMPPVVANYIARLVDATHPGGSCAAEGVKFGASPRAALGLAAASRARALLEGRLNASFEDVAAVALPVLAHRVLLDFSARLAGETSARVVTRILAEVPRQARETPTTLANV